MGGSDSPVDTSSSTRPLATVGGRLALAVVLPVIALLLAATVVARFQARPFVLEQSRREVQAAVNLKQDSISEWLAARRNLASLFAELAGQPPWEFTDLEPLASSIGASLPDIERIVVANPSGVLHFGTSGNPMGDLRGDPFFDRALAGESPITFEPAGPENPAAGILFATPISGGDAGVAGVVILRANAGRLQRVLRSTAQRYGVDTALLDANGQVIAASVEAESRWPDCVDGGGSTVCGSRIVPETGWTVLAWAEIGAIAAGFRRYNVSLLITVAGITTLLIVASTGIAQSIVVPLRDLQQMSIRIAAGEDADEHSGAVSPGAPLELRQLSLTMRAMAAEVRGRQSELRVKALTDPLTALANREHLNAEGPRIIEMCARAREAWSLLMLDIDHFKRVNDTHGHPVGDLVLRAVAECLPASLRGGDFIARYGGEEFVVILPRTDESACLSLAQRVRQTVGACAFTDLGIADRITVSIGAITIHPQVHDPDDDPRVWYRNYLDDAVREADKRLLLAKRRGRNRVVATPRGV